ncbi:MAG TPA: nucleotide exchange factor GrpE [Methanocorpusculum sp.]|nr:nucleotide exchange factor GrpE [Methanocorpusculum sp.]
MDKNTEQVNVPKNDAKPAEKQTPDEKAVPETTVVDELTKKYDELNDKHLRLAAEFENYKKRARRDQDNAVRYATEKIALDMLDILDNFERALKSDDGKLREGLEQIHKLYQSILSRNGIEVITITKGTQFDPNIHEAIVSIPSDAPEGEIIDTAIPGYMIRDKVLRHAKVAVAQKKE